MNVKMSAKMIIFEKSNPTLTFSEMLIFRSNLLPIFLFQAPLELHSFRCDGVTDWSHTTT